MASPQPLESRHKLQPSQHQYCRASSDTTRRQQPPAHPTAMSMTITFAAPPPQIITNLAPSIHGEKFRHRQLVQSPYPSGVNLPSIPSSPQTPRQTADTLRPMGAREAKGSGN
ncbi:hypothetical protein MN608_01664 [Microdochium nivale]|nr:hypothetical protein MN608_01664 [Microdochium nivale]